MIEMPPDAKCFRSECPRRFSCKRYLAYMLEPDPRCCEVWIALGYVPDIAACEYYLSTIIPPPVKLNRQGTQYETPKVRLYGKGMNNDRTRK
jgi:hypothetical protein